MKLDIELLEWLNLDKGMRPRGKDFMVRCPFHKSGNERTPSFSISMTDEGMIIYHCFGCGEKGNLPILVSKLKGITIDKAITILEKRFGVLVTIVSESVSKIPIYEERYKKKWVNKVDESELVKYSMTKGARKYLNTRLISRKTSMEFGLGYDKWNRRIIFPVRNGEDELMGFVGRTIKNEFPKYKFYEGLHKSEYLYGLHNLPIHDNQMVIIVEGMIDLVYLRSLGIDNSLAIMGSTMSKIQQELLKKNTKSIILALDNDEAGILGTKKAVDSLAKAIPVYEVDWTVFNRDVKDVNNISRAGIDVLMNTSKFSLQKRSEELLNLKNT